LNGILGLKDEGAGKPVIKTMGPAAGPDST